MKEEEKEEDEEEIEGKRRDDADIKDSLVVEEGMIVKFPLVPFATCLLPLQLLLQGSFQQEEVKQPHWRDTQKPNVWEPTEVYGETCSHNTPLLLTTPVS